MTPQEQIEYLATNVMGWHKNNPKWCAACSCWASDDGRYEYGIEQCSVCSRNGVTYRHFEPLTDWNHWRQLELKIAEHFPDDLWCKFYDAIAGDNLPASVKHDGQAMWLRYSAADLPTRVSALISSHKELYDS